MTSLYRCLQSNSCPRHTARFRSTSYSLQGSTPQQGKQDKLQQKWTPRSHCKCLRGMQSKPRLHRCLQSSSCPRHTARFRSTSCSQPSSTPQQGKQDKLQQKWTPRSHCKCLRGMQSKPRLHRCLQSSSCPRHTARFRSTSCSQPSSTHQTGTTNTRSLTWTRCSHCTFQPSTNYTTQWCRCPQSSSYRSRKARSRSTSCSQQGSTPQRDTPCTAQSSHCQSQKSCRQRIPRCRRCLHNRLGSIDRQDMASTLRSCRCLLSSSCLQHTARSRLTSCSPQDSTPPQDKRYRRPWCRCPQQKSCPPRTRRCRWSYCTLQGNTCLLHTDCRCYCLPMQTFQPGKNRLAATILQRNKIFRHHTDCTRTCLHQKRNTTRRDTSRKWRSTPFQRSTSQGRTACSCLSLLHPGRSQQGMVRTWKAGRSKMSRLDT
jgi:hypothetical protein